jgi:hypothetical protein
MLTGISTILIILIDETVTALQHAVSVALDDVAGWGAMLAEALSETGGPLTQSERAWADEALGLGHPAA